jgi:sterol desaturase/sphingolipid hydroxylase (fatty acid hydroxylase superfamily)
LSVSQLQAGADVGARAGWWRRVSLPSLGLAGVTAAVLWAAVAELLQQGRLATVLSAGRAELAAPLLVALVIVTGICERAWPAERRAVLARGHVQDACFVALHAIVVIPLMTLLSVGAAALIGGHASWIELRAARDLPGWLIVPLTVVAMDGANWLAHYADHRLDFLWRFHALHHSQEELSVLTSFRAHPLMHTTGFLLAAVPVAILMPTRPIAPVVITVYVCVGTLQHANLRWTFGPVGRVVVSPAYHRLHHAPDIQRANLGVVLTIWDVLAGRARFPARRQAAGPTGLAGRPVPVEQDACAASALVLMAGQLIEPFTAARPGSGS